MQSAPRWIRFRFIACRLSVALACCGLLPASAGAQGSDGEALPYRQPPIDYFGPASDDSVARLQRRLEMQDVRLEYREGQGYLPSLLDALGVPVASQMLVFAKNSVHARLISPANPRALYFSDEVYVGWVPGSPLIEISAVDPQKGAIFYTLRQVPDAPARIVREESCLLCHSSSNSLHVPGHLSRSFHTDPQGNPTRGYSRIDHDTPLAKRWGGWYVTGDFGKLPHQGNLATAADLDQHERHPDGPGRTLEARRPFDAAKYLADQSDVVALLVHDHQLHAHNLLARVNYEERLGRKDATDKKGIDDASMTVTATEERLVRYVLFVDAAPLSARVSRSSAFANLFSRTGPRDKRGRSFRDFNLETRLFEHRLSYLIDSRAFDGLPAPAKERIYRRLWSVLSGETSEAPYDTLPATERRAIVEILRETKTGLPDEWTREVSQTK